MTKILLIEDNVGVRENTAEILTLASYELITAENGRVGVEKALQEKPDLIICDIMMPVLDGYGVLHLLSKNDETAGIPFIFLTAKAEKSELRKGMEMGADDYLTKPFDDIELLNAIESRLKKKQLFSRQLPPGVAGVSQFLVTAKGLDELRKLSSEHETRSWRKKEEIYSEGGRPKGVYFLISGKVKVARSNESGKELITGLFRENEFFGYLPLLEDTVYSDTATVIEDAETLFISREDFFTLLLRNQEVARTFIHLMANNAAESEERLVKLAYSSVRKRVAEALLTLHRFHQDGNSGNQVFQASREDIANLTGTATETTIRTLSDFKDEGLIALQGGTITILDPAKLKSLRN